ncbi:MAG TPA: cbb3-type cytochrome c oxidase subunit 3 [Gammaproteobacteria bacterium]|nr:cbb3-type cytochrome c oxidase subunit 3 [Gammaproteobacteria bacterium]
MDLGTLSGITTTLALIAFLGVWAWAWSSKRKRSFDEAANLPFADDDIDQNSKGGHHD